MTTESYSTRLKSNHSHFMKDRDWLNVICTTARGEWGGEGTWFIPDLLELTKEICPEH